MLFLFLLLLSPLAQAQDIGLSEALARASRDNSDLRAQRFQELQSSADIDRVKGEFGPRIEALMGVGPITQAVGNATSAREDKHVWGRSFLGKFSITQPLYTWGRQSTYDSAARSGVKVKEAESHLKENELGFNVKEAYFGFELANSLQDFIAGGKAELEKAIAGREKKKGAKEDFRLQIFFREVESREAEVNKYYQLALEGFSLRLGAARNAFAPKEKWLIPVKRERQPVEHYVGLASTQRPEFTQLREGIAAKTNLARAEKKGLLPVVALLGSYEFADTNVRTPQLGPFAYDPYNRSTLALGMGLKLDFQWGLQEAKAGKFMAEAQELEAKETYALRGIETEVRKAYLELEEAEKRLAAATAAYQTGKKWLTGEAIGYGSGLSGSEGLVNAYGARAETAKNYFEAVYRHHMAWATLSKVVGTEVDPALASL